MQLSVEAAAMNLENTAHAGEFEFASVSLNKRVLHSDCFAKYAAAFFKMSRSLAVRLSSALSLAISACSTLKSLLTGSSAFLNFPTQVYNMPYGIPGRLATSTTECPEQRIA